MTITEQRTQLILDYLADNPLMTNAEIADALHLKYRAVQKITNELDKEGLLVGQINNYGGAYSNVSWRLKKS